jgi:ubiquinone/menaquinone biosynthesis C-methylase UbiE
MHVPALSLVYERWWRPALGRVAKGLAGPGMSEERRIARLLLALRSGDGVLDLATGTGAFARDFAFAVGETGLVVALDGSRPMLERAVEEVRRSSLDNLAFVRADATDLPFRDGSFDALCCFAALHLFDDPWAALDEATRVLAQGGRIALFTSCRSRSAPLRTLESALAASSGMKMFEEHEVTDALAQRGFTDVTQHVTGLTQFVGARLASR